MVKIICEGSDDKNFLRLLLNEIKQHDVSLQDISNFDGYIEKVDGKSKLLDSSNYSLLTKQIGTKIKKVLFVFDCDFEDDDKVCGGLENSKEAIESLIQDLNWEIEVDYYIFNKNLDYFIVDTLDKKDNFLGCEECFELKKLNKNRKILTCIYKSLYPKAPFDFSHANFNELKQKLTNLFEGTE